VDEARQMRAQAIVVPMRRRNTGGALFGKTLETVLSDRPCRVIIESTPVDGDRAGVAAGDGPVAT
jgi:APA family basic amino acid/polyamine antiporter